MTLDSISVPGNGPTPCPIMIVGDYPGFDDVGHDPPTPFAGRSGRLLWHMLEKVWNLGPNSVYVTNLIKVLTDPKDGSFEGLLAEGREELRYELATVDPKLIVTLGRQSTRFMLGHDVNMEAVHGILYNPAHDLDVLEARVLPCFNPAAALRNPDFLTYSQVDLEAGTRAATSAILGRPMPPGRSISKKWANARWGTEGIKVRPYPALFIDTEGYPGRPWCLSLYLGGPSAYVVRATDSVGLHVVQDLVNLAKRVVLHNAMFDIGILRSMGITILDEKLEDSMVLAYNLKVHPQGLKNLAMRSMGLVMDEYEDIEGPFAEEKAQTYLARAAEIDWGAADLELEEKNGVLHVKQPRSIQSKILGRFRARDKAFLRGDSDSAGPDADGSEPDGGPTEFRKWWYKQVSPQERSRVEARLGPMPDFTFDDVPPAVALQYAGLDAIVTCGAFGYLTSGQGRVSRTLDRDGLPGSYRIDMDAIPMFERMQANGMAVDAPHFRRLEADLTEKMNAKAWHISNTYNGGVYFNPNSGMQVASLLFDRMGLRSDKFTKTGARLATDDKVLEALRNNHPVVPDVIEYRELATMRDKFAKQIPLRVSPDGRVRGSIKTTRVETGRPSMSNPNLLAIPVRSDWGKVIRDGFVAPEGRRLGSCDLSQIELRVMAHLSGDENMIRLFNQGADLHRWAASQMFGIREDEVDEKKHRYAAKRVGFGVGTGIQAEGLLDQMKLAGVYNYSLKDCEIFINDWLKAFPQFHDFMKHCRYEAKRQGYVEDMWGRVRYLPGASTPFPSIRNEAERQSHSHKIQASAAGIMKRAMKNIWDLMPTFWEQGVYFEPLLQIYDDFICEYDPAYEDLVSSVVEWAMTQSVQLVVPITAEFKSGIKWGSMEKCHSH